MKVLGTENLIRLLHTQWVGYRGMSSKIGGICKYIGERWDKDMFETIDHFAIRTLNLNGISMEDRAVFFKTNGYEYKGGFEFPEKKIIAQYFQHPDARLPKVFISELQVDQLSLSSRKLLESLFKDVTIGSCDLECPPPLNISSDSYLSLREESQYAAWISVFGFQPNHYALLVNSLGKKVSIQGVMNALRELPVGIDFNCNVMGSKHAKVEQFSTNSDWVEFEFLDKRELIPGPYLEFIQRHPDETGALYQGYLEGNANKLFESTAVK